ncbi:hypothetical protein K4G64_39525, partial [Streptomyces sp. WAC04114]|nr:hypothetical protein [Streptomyces sp. WAC04114]
MTQTASHRLEGPAELGRRDSDVACRPVSDSGLPGVAVAPAPSHWSASGSAESGRGGSGVVCRSEAGLAVPGVAGGSGAACRPVSDSGLPGVAVAPAPSHWSASGSAESGRGGSGVVCRSE